MNRHTLEIALPAHNAERRLATTVTDLHRSLAAMPLSWRLTIVDQASDDATLLVATALEQALADVRAIHVAEPRRGAAVRRAWQTSGAPVLAYMSLRAAVEGAESLADLVAAIVRGDSDLAVQIASDRPNPVARALQLARGRPPLESGIVVGRRGTIDALMPFAGPAMLAGDLLELANRDGLRVWTRSAATPTRAASARPPRGLHLAA